MTPQELKNSILQLAIQGKLVEQRPEEGTAAELLEKIARHGTHKTAGTHGTKSRAAHRASFVSSVSSVSDVPVVSPIPDDEEPFDIPESWEWVRLEDLVVKEIKRGKSPVYTPRSGTLVFAQKCNTKAGTINLSLALCLDETKLKKYPESEFMKDKDIVINSTGNGTLGRVGIYTDADNPDKMPIVPDSHVTVVRVNETISVGYVLFALKHYQPFMERLGSGSTNQTELSANTVKSLLIPLPPLAEQKRIVAKIEELLPLIDRYEKAWSRLEDFNKRFPVDMQKSLLQLAIQGKLVEQRPEEGTAAELVEKIFAAKNAKDAKANLTRSRGARGEKATSAPSVSPREKIPDDEKPFDIPESWEWVRLGEIMNSITDGTHRTPRYSTSGIKFVSVKNMSGGFLCLDNTKFITLSEHGELIKRCNPKRGDVLLSKVGTTGVPAIVDTDEPFSIFVSVALLKFNHDCIDEKFLYCLLKSPLVQTQADDNTRGVGNKNWVLDAIAKTMVVLPPLAEQKRIVAKLEELLPLCERLKGSVPL